MTMHLDPTFRYRIDSFEIAAHSRAEFEVAARRSLAFLSTLPGFRGHELFEKISGPTTFDVVTIAAWESEAAIEAAVSRVRAYYAEIGFDMAANLERLGIKASVGNFYGLAR